MFLERIAGVLIDGSPTDLRRHHAALTHANREGDLAVDGNFQGNLLSPPIHDFLLLHRIAT